MANGSDQKDSSGDIMWMLAVFIAAILGIWYFFGDEISMVYLTWKLWQLKLVTLIYPSVQYLQYIKEIEETPIKEWLFADLIKVGGLLWFMNIPLLGYAGYKAYKVYNANPLQKFKRVLSMQTLKESEQRIWPYIAPMVGVDLMKEPFDKGPYAMAMRPYEFAVKYKLLMDERNVNSMDKVKSEKLFIAQLGKPWSGFERLKKHEQALCAIFAAHGCGDKKGAMAAINAIAISTSTNVKKMPDFTAAKPLFKYIEDPRVQAVINKHGYVYTVLAQLIEFSRGTGVFPPSYIIWLRPRDRVLWYTLSCVGRQVSFIEVAGIFGHWKAEQIANHRLDAPYVAQAVEGLERALGEVKVA